LRELQRRYARPRRPPCQEGRRQRPRRPGAARILGVPRLGRQQPLSPPRRRYSHLGGRAPRRPATQADLKTEVAKPLPVGLGDEQRLTQVLLNLVGNAIKFTDAGEVSIAAGARNGHIAVSVTDTGPGLCTNKRSVRGVFVQLELLHKKSFSSISAG